MKKSFFLMGLLALCACEHELYPSMTSYMQGKALPAPTIQSFPHCQNYGCRLYKNVMLNDADWNTIVRSFGSPAKNAAQEREKIAKTIAVFEQIVGPLTETDGDRRGTFVQTGAGQLDCVDESTNTTIYMTLLAQKKLILFHEINQPQVRYPIISGRGWMHQTAVITEKDTGAQYAVDSWFDDNGAPARVIPLQEWHDGWHPDDGLSR